MTEEVLSKLEPPYIYRCRGEGVVIDEDVAVFFGVETRRLNEQVRRNADRFGDDFAFQLSAEEFASLKSQNATSSTSHGGRRKPPIMFTEHGVVMAATVLKTPRAIDASRFIVQAFTANRRTLLATHAGQNLPAAPIPINLEGRYGLSLKLDTALGRVIDAILEPESSRVVQEEAREIAREGLGAIKEYLKKQGIQNEQTLAQVQKLLKEAEAIDAEISARHVETEHRRLALVAKQLRMLIEVQRYTETGSVEGLLAVLKDLGDG